ncbi:MAG: HepT-like ribonuclease domain-containing protein [Thermodesulfobacteriota bacterium]
MQKDDIVYLGHMLDMARKVSVRVADRSKTDFDEDEDLRFVIAHLIQTIGEAAAQVSAPMREVHPEIPWKQITGIRDRIVHDYLGVDCDILWEVATRHSRPLLRSLEAIVPPEPR